MTRRCFGVLGDPIAHSRSPAIHGAAFAALGLDHAYFAFHVPASALAAALAGVRALGLGGVNLTVPHKEAALAHLDDLSDGARRIGAVNTVIVRGDRLLGDNTDSPGFARALAELGGARPRRALVLGGGGAALAVIDALLHHAPVDTLAWVSRDPARTRARVDDPRLQHLDYAAIDAATAGADLLVHCTTVGMHGGAAALPAEPPLDQLAGGARVIDIVYPRPPGGLLDRAAALGFAVQDGREMLLWQGVLALGRWLGRSIPDEAVAAMRVALG